MIRARAGHVLNIGSFTSERLVDVSAHYAASKSALRGLTEALAREVGRYDVKVNLLAPGLLDAGLGRLLPQHRIAEYVGQCALGRLGTADEIAALAVFLVSDDNTFMTGAKLVADGGLSMDVGKLVDDVFHKGWDEFQEFVNPLIAQRARLAGEPMRLVAARGRAAVGRWTASRSRICTARRCWAIATRSWRPRCAPFWRPTRRTGIRRASTRSSAGWRGASASAPATRTPTSAARAATPSRRR